MRTARCESISGCKGWVRLLWKLAVLGALTLVGSRAYAQTCTTDGWGGKGGLYPSAAAAAKSHNFSSSSATNSATYEYFVGAYEGGTEADHNLHYYLHEIDTVAGTPTFCLQVTCGVIDQGDIS